MSTSPPDAPPLSKDALVFGLSYLNGPNARLSFGGEGAAYAITPRARAALDELLAAGFAEVAAPSDQIPGREHYQGCARMPRLAPWRKLKGSRRSICRIGGPPLKRSKGTRPPPDHKMTNPGAAKKMWITPS